MSTSSSPNVHSLETPFSFVKTYKISSYSVITSNIILNESITFTVNFYDETGNYLLYAPVVLSGDAYNGWEGNDNYIFDYLDANLETVINNTNNNTPIFFSDALIK